MSDGDKRGEPDLDEIIATIRSEAERIEIMQKAIEGETQCAMTLSGPEIRARQCYEKAATLIELVKANREAFREIVQEGRRRARR